MRFFGCRRERSARDIVLDDFHGDIIFYDTVNVPDDAVFARNFNQDAKSLVEADGTTMPLRSVIVYYKARFTDGWLQWVRRITQEDADQEFRRGYW